MKRLVLPLVLSLVGCEAETEVPQDSADTSVELPPTAYERDLAPLLLACTGCHSGDEPESGLDLTDIWAISGQESTQTEMSLLEPYNHLESYLWHKVAGTQGIAGGLGTSMPIGDTWSEENIDLLALWIDLGMPE